MFHLMQIMQKPLGSKLCRLSLLAVMFFFISGQVLASNHLHIDTDSHADAACIVCIHAQHQAPPANQFSIASRAGIHHHVYPAPQQRWVQATSAQWYLTRAPPQS